MITKDNFLLFKKTHKSYNYCHTNTDSQYFDLNLNQNLKGSNIFPIQSNSNSHNNKRIGTAATINKISDYALSERYEDTEKLQTWKKSSATDLCSKCSNSLSFNDENEKSWKKNGSSNATNNSILSLRISAHENSNEASSDSLNKNFEKSLLIQKQKQINPVSKFVSENPFEFQRQKNDKLSEPEVSQFKASQRLLNSNKSGLRSNTALTMCATPQSQLETPKKKKVPVLPIKLKSPEKKTTHTPNGKVPLSSTKFPTGDTPKLSLYERIMLKQKENEARLEPLKVAKERRRNQLELIMQTLLYHVWSCFSRIKPKRTIKLDILLPRLGRDIKFTGGELTEHIELLCECAHTFFVINTVGPHSTKYLRLLTQDENDYRSIMELIEKEFKKCQ